ncbi:hypothetical protein [Mycolicibacterium llatzerense]|uniref:hypothetical protein n=1 Tax=Mycolicibacterium llatzerense TaxID=280871 RepID=UPI0021B4FA0F|nr:hypothetical protein [Mycolicibacterium llatzerense]MCT7373190.1 hypothetical protein [Mycolicibacterium llatzerense]
MNASVLPWVRKTVFSITPAEDQQVRIERLEHELAVRDEEIAELKCRVEELESERMEAAGNYRRPVAQSIVRGLS